VSKSGAYPSVWVGSLSYFPELDYPKNIPGTNGVAYFLSPPVRKKQSFIMLTPGAIVIKLFVHNKLVCLSLASIAGLV
jgi:hypothetical protein